jgi:hypothetical protein
VSPAPGSLPDGDRHVVLVGRSGPRRTTVGRLLARLLQRPFADADEQLELSAGRTLSRLAREPGGEILRRREAQLLAHLLAHDVPLVILAPADGRVHRRCAALLARSAVVLALRDEDARASPDRLEGDHQDVADHVLDLEPLTADVDEPGRAVAHHILQLFVTGALRGSIRLPDHVLALSDGLLLDDVSEAMSPGDDELLARLADVADLTIDVEPLRTGDDSPEGTIARHIARLLAADDPHPGTAG